MKINARVFGQFELILIFCATFLEWNSLYLLDYDLLKVFMGLLKNCVENKQKSRYKGKNFWTIQHKHLDTNAPLSGKGSSKISTKNLKVITKRRLMNA